MRLPKTYHKILGWRNNVKFTKILGLEFAQKIFLSVIRLGCVAKSKFYHIFKMWEHLWSTTNKRVEGPARLQLTKSTQWLRLSSQTCWFVDSSCLRLWPMDSVRMQKLHMTPPKLSSKVSHFLFYLTNAGCSRYVNKVWHLKTMTILTSARSWSVRIRHN